MVNIKVLKQKIFDIKNKKIISFCLYNSDTRTTNRNYQNGIFMNYVLSKKFYPGWICRFYIDSTVEQGILSKLDSLEVEYIYIDTNINKMCLRFLPFDDKNYPLHVLLLVWCVAMKVAACGCTSPLMMQVAKI